MAQTAGKGPTVEAGVLDADAVALIGAGHQAHLESIAGVPMGERLGVTLTDGGVLRGGLIARVWGTDMVIEQVWIQAEYRRRGYGRRLVELAERQGMAAGAVRAYFNTMDPNAIAFFTHLGYSSACTIEGYPLGLTLRFMTRSFPEAELPEGVSRSP